MSRHREGYRPPREAVAFAAILAAAILVRVVFLGELTRSELGTVPSLDARFYRDLAEGLAQGRPLPPGAFTFNPLYPYFLALVIRLFGAGLLAPLVIQSALGVLTIVLVYAGARRLAEGPRVGKPSAAATAGIAAAAALLYPQPLVHEGMLLATSLEVFLFAAAWYLALALDQALLGERETAIGTRRVPPAVLAALLGACIGAGALGRPNLFLLLAAALPVWLLIRHRRRRRGLAPALLVVAGAALFLAPPIARNARETGRFVPVTAHGGINLYIGNRPGSPGVYEPPAHMRGDMRGLIEDARAAASAARGRPLSDAEVSDYYAALAREEIARDPAGWLRLVGKKLVLFWNRVEVPDVPNAVFIERSCRVLRALVIPFAAIAPLAAAGLVALWRSRRNRGAVAVFLGSATVSVLPFFVNTRYRLPALPVMAGLAAFAVAAAARDLSRRRWRQPLALALFALAVFALVTARPAVRVNDGAAYAFLGNYYVERGDEARAAEAFAEAYRLDPGQTESMINYARVLMKRGDAAAAVPLYERAHARIPRFPRLAIEYGAALEKVGRREEAKRLYEEALGAERPAERVLACRLLAQAALAEGNRDAAIAWIRRALEIAPGDAEAAGMLRWLESGR